MGQRAYQWRCRQLAQVVGHNMQVCTLCQAGRGIRACFHGFPGGLAPGGVEFMAPEVQLLSMDDGGLAR